MRAELTDADVVALMNNPVAEIRAKLATKIAFQVAEETLTPVERQIAHDILRSMAVDISVIVREAMAQNLRHAKHLPKDVALTLARDVESVALPLLESSPIFSDEDLVELVKMGSPAKQVAIAGREYLSENVSYALVEMENEDAVVAMLANETAEINEDSLTRTLDIFGESDNVKSAMTHREQLPALIAERLVTMVTEQLRQHLLIHHDLPADLVSDLVIESREQATMSIIETNGNRDQATRLVSQLYSHGRLTPTLVLRSLCLGDMDFCEHAFSHLAVVSLDHARKLVHDPGPLGFEAIYDRAGMPPALFPIFRLAMDVFEEFEDEPRPADRSQFCTRMIEHVQDDRQTFSKSDRDYLLSTLTRITAAA